jgi:hypothetical protein
MATSRHQPANPVLNAFLSHQRYGVISSISSHGQPQSALVGIAVTSSLEIVFDTLRSTRKYPNLVARPRCSFVIGWSGEQTVQLEGDAFEPKPSDLALYQRAYFNIWPDGQARKNWPNIAYFVVRPRWIRYSDYATTPPLVEELNFPAP